MKTMAELLADHHRNLEMTERMQHMVGPTVGGDPVEQQVIHGILSYRKHGHDIWRRYDLKQMTKMIMEQRETIADLEHALDDKGD